MSTKNSQKYTINFIESLKNSENIGELPKETVQYISDIDKELNKYFKFLLEKNHLNSMERKVGIKNFKIMLGEINSKREKNYLLMKMDHKMLKEISPCY